MNADTIMILGLVLASGVACAVPLVFIAVAFHRYLPNRTFIVAVGLALIETACGVVYVYARMVTTNPTGLEVLLLLPIILAILLGNLVAIPIARLLWK